MDVVENENKPEMESLNSTSPNQDLTITILALQGRKFKPVNQELPDQHQLGHLLLDSCYLLQESYLEIINLLFVWHNVFLFLLPSAFKSIILFSSLELLSICQMEFCTIHELLNKVNNIFIIHSTKFCFEFCFNNVNFEDQRLVRKL